MTAHGQASEDLAPAVSVRSAKISSTLALYRRDVRNVWEKNGKGKNVEAATNAALFAAATSLCEDFREGNPQLELSPVQAKGDQDEPLRNVFFFNVEIENWPQEAIRAFYRWMVSVQGSRMIVQHPTAGKVTVKVQVKASGARSVTLQDALEEPIVFMVKTPAGCVPDDKKVVQLVEDQFRDFGARAKQLVQPQPNGAGRSQGVQVEADRAILSDPRFMFRRVSSVERAECIKRSTNPATCGLQLETDQGMFVVPIQMPAGTACLLRRPGASIRLEESGATQAPRQFQEIKAAVQHEERRQEEQPLQHEQEQETKTTEERHEERRQEEQHLQHKQEQETKATEERHEERRQEEQRLQHKQEQETKEIGRAHV